MKLVDLVIKTFPIWPSNAGYIVQDEGGWMQAYTKHGKRLELIGRNAPDREEADETKACIKLDPAWSNSNSDGGLRITKLKYTVRKMTGRIKLPTLIKVCLFKPRFTGFELIMLVLMAYLFTVSIPLWIVSMILATCVSISMEKSLQ